MNRLPEEKIAAQIYNIASAMQEAIKDTKSTNPAANMGALAQFVKDEWVAGIEFKAGQLFTYKGDVGFVRQDHTSQLAWLPFTPGTESLYGARPAPDADGVYPYVYNMKVDVDMKVRSRKDSEVYTAIQASDPLFYDPADVPALFKKENV